MFDTLFERHRELQRRRAEEGFDGFTLIELLIVIVVIAILAATVIFALGGIQGSSAQAACTSDAKSVDVAINAYHAYPANAGAWPTTIADLTGTTNGGPYLQSAPNNPHYTVELSGDTGGGTLPAGATTGHVYVGPKGGALVDFDTEAAGQGCLGVS